MIWSPAEQLPRAELRELQRERLLAAFGVELGSLTELPFSGKADLRDAYPFGLLRVPVASLARVHASSGTHGKPTVVGYTSADLEAWTELMARCMTLAGVRPGMLVHNASTYGLFTGGHGFHQGAERIGAPVVPVSGGMTARQAVLLHDLGAQVLVSTPSYAIAIAHAVEEAGIDPATLKLELGLFGGEPWTDGLRAQIESALPGLRAVNFYGLSEMCGPGVAAECIEARDGLHVHEDHFVVEVVDSESGAVLGENDEGELVFTTLVKEAMPFLRYRTGDIGSLTSEPCKCGRTTARIRGLRGRRDDMVSVRGVNVYPSNVEHALLSVPEAAAHYQLVVARSGAMDELTVQCEPAGAEIDPASLRADVERVLREHLGIRVRAEVLARGAVPRSEGKAVRVVDRRFPIGRAGTTPSVTPRIEGLRAEHRRDALGIGARRPRLSWRLADLPSGWRQSAYEVEAASSGHARRSVRVESAESVLVPWPFEPLRSRERVTVRVRAHSADAPASAWSDELEIEAGLLEVADWSARFVTPTWPEDTTRPQPAAYLRREFDLPRAPARARLYATALGVYELQLNGAVVSDHVLAPGWTSYEHRLRYQTFDVTALLSPGRNALGAIVADGWYRGRLGFFGGRRNIYGDRLALLAQLEIEDADGTIHVVGTDGEWRGATGPILAADLYDGETYDSRLERDGWATPGYDDDEWNPVETLDRDLATLVAPTGPPVRRIELLDPVSVARSPSGATIVDFGQNLVGRVRLTVEGEPGCTITLRHAEVLENGELCVRPLRSAAATDRYVVRGGGAETWEPRFTFHGFRYVEITGWPGDVDPDAIRAVVCHSDLERTGWFECSDPLVNRLHENVVWSMRGNFLDVPTDCPQRDERLGWTGDIAVFAPTAAFLYDCAGLLASWLADLASEQREAGGRVPSVVPDVLPAPEPGRPHDWAAPTAGWGDAAVVVPWVLHQRFGDRQVLEDQYESMRSWVELVASLAGPPRLWREGFQWGDWLDPTAPPDRPERGRTDPSLVATAYFAHSADVLARVASALGHGDDEARFATLAAEVRAAFGEEYVKPDGVLASDSPTAYALALQFSLLPGEEQRLAAGRRLAEIVEADDYRIGTGFLGTPLICDALCSVGEYDKAYRLLMQRECPSWLYPVSLGATTVWERWDAILPGGEVNPGGGTSFNHYAFGAVADWLHRTVAGLAPLEPGYRTLQIRPRPGGGLTHARARHLTPYGEAAAAWRIEGGTLLLDVTVPPATTARVTLPGADDEIVVGPGSHSWTSALVQPCTATRGR